MKSAVGKYLTISTLLAAVLCGMSSGCSDLDDLGRKQARRLIEDAASLEAQGHVFQVYRQYSLVGNNVSHGDTALVARGLENSARLAGLIHAACEPADKAIRKYHDEHGTYPESLDDMKIEVPEPSRIAFTEFRLATLPDGKAVIDCGLWGPVSEFPE